MILEYSVENTFSIGERQLISFEATGYDEKNPHHYIDINGVKILKMACIYGANASGKTKMAESLGFYLFFMVKSFYDLKPEQSIPFIPFLYLQENPNNTNGSFEIIFYVHNKEEDKYIKYKYNLTLNRKCVVNETLIYYPKGFPALVFDRKYQNIEWGPSIKGEKSFISNLISENCSVISFCSKSNIKEVLNVYEYVSNRYTGMVKPFSDLISQNTLRILDTDTEVKNQAIGMLAYADFGSVTNIDIETDHVKPRNGTDSNEEIESETNKIRTARLVHKYNGIESSLPIALESAGTRRMLQLSVPLSILTNSTTMVIDEIEASLHQELLEAFLIVFLEVSKDSQLLFTTHNQELLDSGLLLDDEIWFCYKTENGNSVYNSVSDFTGFRKETSRKKLYKTGRFGALPNIDIQGLKELFYASQDR